MALNHASVSASAESRDSAINWLKDIAVGMARLVNSGVVQCNLRMSQSVHETRCLPGYSLFDAYQGLGRTQECRDQYLFLLRLVTKTPLLSEIEQDVEDRFRACEQRTLPPNDGKPLVLCAITDWIAIGFPSDSIWDRDQVTVSFDELLPDETIVEVSERIDNLTRSVHAGAICDRNRARLRAGIVPHVLWSKRESVFPNLFFGPDVENHLATLPSERFQTVVGKLAALDAAAERWRSVGGSVPPWPFKVTPESLRVRNNELLLRARRFRSHRGAWELFEWHARFGNSGRIHVRFDPGSKEVEVGYIGPHLPL